MSGAQDPLKVLGLGGYGSAADSDSESEEEEDRPATATPVVATTPAVAPSVAKAALPDADDLLAGGAGGVDFLKHAAKAAPEPSIDKAGTSYNAVALPQSMVREAYQHNERGKSMQAKRASSGASSQLLPPQLRRPNVATEDLSAWQSAKRVKTNGAGQSQQG